VPRIIHTINFETYCKGLNFDIEPKHTISPKGTDKTSVSMNKRHVVPNPVKSCRVTSENEIVAADKVIIYVRKKVDFAVCTAKSEIYLTIYIITVREFLLRRLRPQIRFPQRCEPF